MLGLRSRTGLTIAELMVASGLLSIVLVTILALFFQLIRNSNKNALMSAGSFFADSVMERQVEQAKARMEILTDNRDDVFDTDLYPLEGSGMLSISANDPKTEYLYRVEVERLDQGLTADPGQLWALEVEVRWWQESASGEAEARAGMGRMDLTRGKIVYLSGGR